MAEQTTEDARERDKRIAEGIGWHGLEWGGVPDWSNDPAAVFGAGGLVEAMRKKGWAYNLNGESVGTVTSAFFRRGDSPMYYGEGDTPSAAVSEAAAAALRGAETRTDDGE